MGNYLKNHLNSNENFVHIYTDISKEDLGNKIDQLMFSSGYKRVVGQPGDGVYEKGNKTMRILFGAFIKYFKFNVLTFTDETNEIRVQVTKESSGMSGGLIGIDQVKKELLRLAQIFSTI